MFGLGRGAAVVEAGVHVGAATTTEAQRLTRTLSSAALAIDGGVVCYRRQSG
jgi:hypothetical protein